MRKPQKETNQIPVIIEENLLKISSVYRIPVRVITKAGEHHTGIWERPAELFRVGTGATQGIYLRFVGDRKETHTIIPSDSVDSISFVTELGFLDDLVDSLC